jgi:hypothetical protein
MEEVEPDKTGKKILIFHFSPSKIDPRYSISGIEPDRKS